MSKITLRSITIALAAAIVSLSAFAHAYASEDDVKKAVEDAAKHSQTGKLPPCGGNCAVKAPDN
jgi:methionine-rich copper-binding protein CopC